MSASLPRPLDLHAMNVVRRGGEKNAPADGRPPLVILMPSKIAKRENHGSAVFPAKPSFVLQF
jgi:hypothetical protein